VKGPLDVTFNLHVCQNVVYIVLHVFHIVSISIS